MHWLEEIQLRSVGLIWLLDVVCIWSNAEIYSANTMTCDISEVPLWEEICLTRDRLGHPKSICFLSLTRKQLTVPKWNVNNQVSHIKLGEIKTFSSLISYILSYYMHTYITFIQSCNISWIYCVLHFDNINHRIIE